MKEEPEVQVKNAELTLASVRTDIVLETEILSEIHRTKHILLEDIENKKAELKAEEQSVEKAKLDLQDERNRIKEERKSADLAVVHSKKELEVIHDQKRLGMKELGQLNEWILKAENQKVQLDEDLAQAEQLKKEKKDLEIVVESLKQEAIRGKEVLGKVKLETSLLVEDAENRTRQLATEAEKAEETRDKALLDVEMARIVLHDTQDQATGIKKDLETVIQRIEVKYGEAFPDLRMGISF